MRVRNKPWAKERIEEYSQFVVSDPALWKGRWQERFGNKHPIHIEVGTGKGQFIYNMAKNHPDINYIGIEINMNVVVVALDKLIEEPLANLQLLHVNGGEVTEYFATTTAATIFGPVSLDLALSKEAVAHKRYEGPIMGDADVLVVPAIDAGNFLYKALTMFGGALVGGTLVGTKVPIVLTSRSDSLASKLHSLEFAMKQL